MLIRLICFRYVFNNGISLCDIGKLNADNTVNIHDGHIILDYKDFLIMWNYTSDAKQYNVLQINGRLSAYKRRRFATIG